MSYRRAWILVDTMNRCFSTPLVRSAKGGFRGGGAEVTPAGLEALEAFRRMQAEAELVVERHLVAFQKLADKSKRRTDSVDAE